MQMLRKFKSVLPFFESMPSLNWFIVPVYMYMCIVDKNYTALQK